MTDTPNNTPEITPEMVAELLGNIKRHDEWEFKVAQVDSICYPPDSNYGSIRLNSMTAYAYSHQMRTGHHVRAIVELANNAPDIARAYLKLHEENQQLQQDKIDLANGSNQWAAEASKLHEENQQLNVVIEEGGEIIGELKEENQRLQGTVENYAKLFKHLKMGDIAREALKDHKE